MRSKRERVGFESGRIGHDLTCKGRVDLSRHWMTTGASGVGCECNRRITLMDLVVVAQATSANRAIASTPLAMMTRKYDALLPHTRPLKHLYTHWATRALSCVKRVAALLASSQESQCCFFWQNLSTHIASISGEPSGRRSACRLINAISRSLANDLDVQSRQHRRLGFVRVRTLAPDGVSPVGSRGTA